MKIRTGFVSNSSTSSFVINTQGDFKTVKEVAQYIIDICENEAWSNYHEVKENLNKMSNPDTPVHFNTGGDYTYIRKVDDKIVIATTQNITFDKIYDNCVPHKELTKSFYKQFNYFDKEYNEKYRPKDIEDLEGFYQKFNDFLILEHNFFGKHEYIDNCEHCKSFTKGWKLRNNKTLCTCQLDKYLNFLKRKEKLEKINKQNED